MKRKIFLLFILLSLFVGSVHAEEIVFKSGKKIDAKILDRKDEWIEIDVEGVRITYFLSDIDTIDGQKVVPAATEAPAPSPAVSSTSAPAASSTSVAPSAPASASTAVPANQAKPAVNAPSAAQDLFPSARSVRKADAMPEIDFTSEKGKMALAAMGGILLVIIIFGILGYIYNSICLYFIAKKTGTTPAWLAWVPIGQLFLMCSIGGVSYLWLLLFIGMFIPLVSLIASLGLIFFSIYIWYKIAIACNKPGWLGALVILPLAGLIIMGYLAFSSADSSLAAPEPPPEPTPPPQTPPPPTPF